MFQLKFCFITATILFDRLGNQLNFMLSLVEVESLNEIRIEI